MKTNYYRIETSDWMDDFLFDTLREAKHHIYSAYTKREAARKFSQAHRAMITHTVGEEIVSTTAFYADEDGNINYGRTTKY